MIGLGYSRVCMSAGAVFLSFSVPGPSTSTYHLRGGYWLALMDWSSGLLIAYADE